MLQIEAELNRAKDIDAVLTNNSSIEDFHRQVDAVVETVQSGSDYHASVVLHTENDQ